MTVTSLYIRQFGKKEFVQLSPKVRQLFEKIDSLPSASSSQRKAAPTEKRVLVRR